MAQASPGSRRLWVLATAIAIAVVALISLLFREPAAPPPPPAAQRKPVVEMHAEAEAGDALFKDKAIFKDSVPLFLPTVWNSSPPERKQRVPEGVFRDYPPEFAFGDSELRLDLATPIAVPARPADALEANPPGNPYLGMGEQDEPVPALAARWAEVEIFAAGNGVRAYGQALTNASDRAEAPPIVRLGTWQPLEFKAAVDPAGLVGPLMPTVRSVTPVDNAFLQLDAEALQWLEKYLAQRLRVGDKLAPGFYRICVGP